MQSLLFLVTNLTIRLWTSLPPTVIHNLQKSRTIQLLFWQQNVEGVHGDYVEFGVASGNSIMSAVLSSQRASSRLLSIRPIPRSIHGFDTFESFMSSSTLDKHVSWSGKTFSFPFARIQKRFKKYSQVSLHKINAEELNSSILKQDLNISEKVSIVLFDMDLYKPTKSALDWISDCLQNGTFLVFDEYFAFLGDKEKGESRALKEFLEENPKIHVRQISTYGAGGAVFVVQIDKS